MYKKLTDSEIVKALECKPKTELIELCNRLQAENEELKDTVKVLRVGVEQAHIIRKDGKSPFNLLKAEIKAEAYKEFAERLETIFNKLKNNLPENYLINKTAQTFINAFQLIKKELVGDEQC